MHVQSVRWCCRNSRKSGAERERFIPRCCHITHWELTFQAFPNVVAHFKRMQERPSFKKLLA
jgi:glutathione S-transferase